MEQAVNEDFSIDVEWLESSNIDPVEQATFSYIEIRTAKETITELEDQFAKTVRGGLRASAYSIAMWLTGNWWRLRWEPEAKKVVDWRLSHSLAAAGGGFAWPNVSFISDGVHVIVEARKTRASKISPVRYLRDVDVSISAAAFEAEIDQFVERVLARLSSVKINSTELSQLWKHIIEERKEHSLANYRRLEALMGFNADAAPSQLMSLLQKEATEAGHDSVDEVAAAAKERAPQILRESVERTEASNIAFRIESVEDITNICQSQSSNSNLPWVRAAKAAQLARDVWGVGQGPISNDALAELLAIPQSFLRYTPSNGVPITAGLRNDQNTDAVKVAIRAKVQTGRRFEIMRLVADNLVAPSKDKLLPVTTAKTDRQKFQRAFAQEFLMPFEELYRWLGEPDRNEAEIGEDEIEDIATEYDVSPQLVRTVLVNKGYLPRELLPAVN